MLETIITSSVLIIALLLLRAALKGKISSRLRYGLWLAVVVRLLLPFPLTESSISVMNLFTPEEKPSAEISGILSDIPGYPEAAEAYPNDLPDMPQSLDNTDIDKPSDTLDIRNVSISMYRFDNSDNTEDAAFAEHIVEEYLKAAADRLPANDRDYVSTPLIPENTPGSSPTASGENIPDDTDVHGSLSYKKIIICIWAAVSAAGLLWFGGVNIAFGRKLRKCRREVNCASPLPVYRTDHLKSPCLFGKAVYINEQPPKHLKYIIAHEYSHYCHGDHIWSAVRQILLCVYWFNPLVWAAAVISKNDCECACDEAAMELIGESDRTEYGRALLEMIPSKGANLGIAATSMSGRGRALAERLRLIAAKPLSKRSAKVIAAKTAAVLIALIACGCTFTTSQNLGQDNGNASNADIADNGIAVTPESPAPARNERQYSVNAAHRSYDTYLHAYDNYREFYENNAAEVYADSLTVNPEEFGEFSAFFNLWIKYRNKTMETVRINYSPEDEKFYQGEPFEVGYFPEFAQDYLTLLPDKPYEEVFSDSWDDYVRHNYPCDLYDQTLMDEPVQSVWIAPLTFTDTKSVARAGFIAESENYISIYGLSTFEDGHGGYTWNWRTGDNMFELKKDPDTDYAASGYTLAQTREEYYSRQKYHPGDVLHSFKKQVPLAGGSGTVTRTVELVMTKEDYPNGLPNLNYELQGDFALRILDSEGNVTGECPIETAAVDVNGNTTVTVSDMYLSRYFKYSKDPDRLLVFSVPSGYHDGGWHNYTAFFGITDEGEIFRYHIDKGEFDYPAYMGGNELFTGELYGNARLYSESGAMVSKDGHYLVNIERQRNGEENLNILLFDETAHIIKSAYNLTGRYDEELMTGARDVICEKYNYLFMRHIQTDNTWGEISFDPDFGHFDSIVFEGDSWQDYVNMPMGEITDRDLFYALSAEAEERHPGIEDMIPFFEHGSKEYVVHFNSDYMGEAWTYASDAVMAEETEDGSRYVYYVSFGCDYYSVCRYKAEKSGDKWVLGEFERII